MTMTKRDLVVRVARQANMKQSDVMDIIQLTLDTITEELAEGHNIEFRNFGVFEVLTRKARVGRNPNSPKQTVNRGLDTIRDAKAKEKVTDGLALHSDQGFQYTSQEYFNLTQAYHISPSMSRRGNPYDNALAENFFSILKTECIHRVKLRTFSEAEQVIDEYIHFYNHVRLQSKTKLTPVEFRNQFCA